MKRDDLCERIIEKHYSAVLRFCSARLPGDRFGAEECTQEVFLLFLQKQHTLDLSGEIGKWLLAAAFRITKKYLREKALRAGLETDGAEEIPDSTPQNAARAPAFAALTDEEYELLLSYYSADGTERCAIASELGISVNALYQRIYAIKSKIDYTKR